MRCVWPLPPDEKANRIDAKFLDPQYPEWRRRMGLPPDEHPGIDINLTGTSGNADEGYPVVAILPGHVVHAKSHRVWGNIVLIQHPPHVAEHFGLAQLWSQYAHLKFVSVKEGDYLLPGEPVGSIGRGDPSRPFLAHLHFELRIANLPADHWPRTKQAILSSYLDPESFLRKHADYSRRYFYPMSTIFGPSKRINLYGESVANLDLPGTLRVRVPNDIL